MIQFLALQILMENTACPDLKRMEDHYKAIRSKYGAGLSFHRYKELFGALIPTQEEILLVCQLLMDNSCRYYFKIKFLLISLVLLIKYMVLLLMEQ